VLVRLADALSADIAVCIVADRGFGDQKLYRVLSKELNFDYVIRFRGNITVIAAGGEARTAAAWVGPNGRPRVLRGALVTAEHYRVGTVQVARWPNSLVRRQYGADWRVGCRAALGPGSALQGSHRLMHRFWKRRPCNEPRAAFGRPSAEQVR
jgi:hypothetical protein